MKIHLERTLSTCPETLTCVACNSSFEPTRIRTLLCSDQGLIHGDVCPCCLKQGRQGIQQNLKERAIRLLNQYPSSTQTLTDYKTALEQLERSAEDIELPKFYHWWLKRLEVLSQETQELEKARLGLSNCQCGRPRSRLRIVFQDEEGTVET